MYVCVFSLVFGWSVLFISKLMISYCRLGCLLLKFLFYFIVMLLLSLLCLQCSVLLLLSLCLRCRLRDDTVSRWRRGAGEALFTTTRICHNFCVKLVILSNNKKMCCIAPPHRIASHSSQLLYKFRPIMKTKLLIGI